MNLDSCFGLIEDVADFPKPGITFKDITPIFENPDAFAALTDAMNSKVPEDVTTLAAIESRGFILAAAMSQRVPRKIVLLRKPGKLPRKTISVEYELEYGTDTLQVHDHSIESNEKVCISRSPAGCNWFPQIVNIIQCQSGLHALAEIQGGCQV